MHVPFHDQLHNVSVVQAVGTTVLGLRDAEGNKSQFVFEWLPSIQLRCSVLSQRHQSPLHSAVLVGNE